MAGGIVKRTRHAAYLVRDYPNALRIRAQSVRRTVPRAWGQGEKRPVVI